MAAYSRLFDRAVLAAIVHQDMPRKGTVIPDVIHPVHVATILLRHGYGETLAIAGLLHDVLEDIDYDNGRVQLAVRATFPAADLPEKIVTAGMYQAAFDGFVAREFPADVLSLVRAVTEPRDAGARPWKERKRSTIARLRDASPDVARLKAADALHKCTLHSRGHQLSRRDSARPFQGRAGGHSLVLPGIGGVDPTASGRRAHRARARGGDRSAGSRR